MENESKKVISKEHFQNLVVAALADGDYDKSEMNFFIERAKELGIPDEEIEVVMKYKLDFNFIIPQTIEEKEEQLSDIVLLSLVDGEIHEKEYSLCLKISEKMELDKKYLDQAIKLSKKLMDLE